MPRITIRRTTLICVTIIVYVALKPKFSSDSDISTQVELDALVFNDYYFQSKNPEKYKPKLSKPWTPKKIRTVDTNSREYQILKEKEAFLHEAERRNAIMKTTSPLPRKCDQLPKNLDDYPHQSGTLYTTHVYTTFYMCYVFGNPNMTCVEVVFELCTVGQNGRFHPQFSKF